MSNTRRLLLIVPSIISYKAFLIDLCHYLIEIEGWEVTVICNKEDLNFIDNKVNIIHVDMPRGINVKGYLLSIKQIRLIIADLKPSLIHVHFSAAALVVALAKQKNWPPIITTLQGVIFSAKSGFSEKIYRIAELFAFKKYKQVWVLTDDDLQALKKANISAFRQVSMGFGCRSEIFDPLQYSEQFRAKNRKELGIAPTDIVTVFIGRLVDFKGIHIAYRAFKRVRETFPNLAVKFLIIGDFDHLHASGLTKIEVADIVESPDIIWPGYVSNVQEYLAIADINIFPSIREGMPVNLMESLSMGVPVITYNSRGCRDVVQNGYTGIVVDDRTPEAFADAMHLLITNPFLRRTFSINSLSIRNNFSRTLYIKEQVDVYNDILK